MTKYLAECNCGQLRVRAAAEPVRVSVWHCLACQRRTGSAFGVQARFREAAIQISGTSCVYVRVADSGNKITFHFCPNCGSTVHYRLDSHPELVAVPVGAFAEPGFPGPAHSVYESRMHPGVRMPLAIEHVA